MSLRCSDENSQLFCTGVMCFGLNNCQNNITVLYNGRLQVASHALFLIKRLALIYVECCIRIFVCFIRVFSNVFLQCTVYCQTLL